MMVVPAAVAVVVAVVAVVVRKVMVKPAQTE
jgi:hypothetical protein